MVLGLDEVLDQVRGAHVVECVALQRQKRPVGADRVHARSAVGSHRGCCGLGVVVDADELASATGEPNGLVTEAASHVQEATVAHPRPDLAVARCVQREQRIGGLALHGSLTGELHGLLQSGWSEVPTSPGRVRADGHRSPVQRTGLRSIRVPMQPSEDTHPTEPDVVVVFVSDDVVDGAVEMIAGFAV